MCVYACTQTHMHIHLSTPCTNTSVPKNPLPAKSQEPLNPSKGLPLLWIKSRLLSTVGITYLSYINFLLP